MAHAAREFGHGTGSTCDLMKPGPNMGEPSGGDRFKEIAADLQKMASGDTRAGECAGARGAVARSGRSARGQCPAQGFRK